MPSKTSADPVVGPMIRDLIEDHHPDLKANGVTVDADFAWRGKDGGWAVRLHGVDKAATIRKNPVDARRKGVADATITIEAEYWKTLPEPSRVALVDHELTHLEVARSKRSGNVRTDDADRPVLVLLPHDWDLGGFDSVARRHGDAALEVQATRQLRDARGQLFFAWDDDQAPPPDPAPFSLSAAGA